MKIVPRLKQRQSKNRVILMGYPGPASIEQEAFFKPINDVEVIVCGSKAGKTYNLTARICRDMWRNPNQYNTWTAPYRNQTDHSFRIAQCLFPKKYMYVNKSEMRIELKHNGSVLKYMPACDPEALEGAGNTTVVIDEASKAAEAVYESALTTVSRTKGKIIVTTTPRGMDNWVYRLYNKGLDPLQRHISSARYPTFINPFVDLDKLCIQAETMPEDSFRQYILGEFLPGAGAQVFRGVDDAFEHPHWGWQQVVPREQYFIGADLARLQDYSVLTVSKMDENGHIYLVDFWRMPHEDWDMQARKITELHKRWNNAPIMVDATGVGQPFYEDLRKTGLPVSPYVLGTESKRMLIERGQLAFEAREIHLPDIAEVRDVLGVELKQMEYTLSKSGHIGMSAPRGCNDDAAISLCLNIFYAKNVGVSSLRLENMNLGPANNPRMGGTRTFRQVRDKVRRDSAW